MEFKGTVTHYIDKSGVSKKNNEPFVAWQIRLEEEFVQYPMSLLVDFFGDKVTAPPVGSMATVYYNPRADVAPDGKIWGKNNGWKIVLDGAVAQAPVQNKAATPQAATSVQGSTDEGQDLPF